MIWQILGAFLASVAGSIFLEAPKKYMFHSGYVGAIGWGTYLLSSNLYSPVASTYIAGLVISTLSHLLSRIHKIPVTSFFIPGVFPLVPGLSMYRAVYHFINGFGQTGQVFLEEVIKISGMIALAIFTIDMAFKIAAKFKKSTQ